MEKNCIICAGNISDGFVFHGPFESFDDAHEWGDRNVIGEYWIATLNEANSGEDEKK